MHILIFPSKNLGKKCSYTAKIQSLFQIFQHLPLVIPVHSGTASSACTPNWPALTRQLGSSLPEWVDTQEWYMSTDRTGRDTNWHLPSTSLNQLPVWEVEEGPRSGDLRKWWQKSAQHLWHGSCRQGAGPDLVGCWGECGPAPPLCPESVSYTHLTLPTISLVCRSRWSPYH